MFAALLHENSSLSLHDCNDTLGSGTPACGDLQVHEPIDSTGLLLPFLLPFYGCRRPSVRPAFFAEKAGLTQDPSQIGYSFFILLFPLYGGGGLVGHIHEDHVDPRNAEKFPRNSLKEINREFRGIRGHGFQ